MADYFSPTVIQSAIPIADITPLERLVLGHIFSAQPDGDDRLYFYADETPAGVITVEYDQLVAARAASQTTSSCLIPYLQEHPPADPYLNLVDLDLSGTSWEFIFQDIVCRSKSLRYVTAVSAFTCSKMRPDGFGGMAVLITAAAIVGKSTNDIIEDFLDEAFTDAGDAGPVITKS
jgi:hypothetical protein